MSGAISRTVTPGLPVGLAPRGRVPAAVPCVWPNKDTADTLDYAVDFSALLAGSTDIVAAATATGMPVGASGLTLGPCSCAGTLVTLTIGGGTPGVNTVVTVTAFTAGGLTLNANVALYINLDVLGEEVYPGQAALATEAQARAAADAALTAQIAGIPGVTLQPAATNQLGGIKPGSFLAVAADGTLTFDLTDALAALLQTLTATPNAGGLVLNGGILQYVRPLFTLGVTKLGDPNAVLG